MIIIIIVMIIVIYTSHNKLHYIHIYIHILFSTSFCRIWRCRSCWRNATSWANPRCPRGSWRRPMKPIGAAAGARGVLGDGWGMALYLLKISIEHIYWRCIEYIYLIKISIEHIYWRCIEYIYLIKISIEHINLLNFHWRSIDFLDLSKMSFIEKSGWKLDQFCL